MDTRLKSYQKENPAHPKKLVLGRRGLRKRGSRLPARIARHKGTKGSSTSTVLQVSEVLIGGLNNA
jgi:hypothetical protein